MMAHLHGGHVRVIVRGHSKTSRHEFHMTCSNFDATSHICVSTYGCNIAILT